jgi:hypothetical protein
LLDAPHVLVRIHDVEHGGAARFARFARLHERARDARLEQLRRLVQQCLLLCVKLVVGFEQAVALLAQHRQRLLGQSRLGRTNVRRARRNARRLSGIGDHPAHQVVQVVGQHGKRGLVQLQQPDEATVNLRLALQVVLELAVDAGNTRLHLVAERNELRLPFPKSVVQRVHRRDRCVRGGASDAIVLEFTEASGEEIDAFLKRL